MSLPGLRRKTAVTGKYADSLRGEDKRSFALYGLTKLYRD
jgi:hypothetical protein